MKLRFSKHFSPAGMHCQHDYILSQYPFYAEFQQLSETICQLIYLGLGFILSAKAMSKCLRDNRYLELKSSYLWKKRSTYELGKNSL